MNTLQIRPRTVTLYLLAGMAVLLFGSVATQYARFVHGHDLLFGLVRLLYAGGEQNVPSWYSACLLLLSAAALGLIALCGEAEVNPYRRQWGAIAFVFLYLSFDEASSIHELADPQVEQWLEASGYVEAVLSVIGTAWVLAGAAFAAVAFLAFRRFLRDLPGATRARFLIAGGLYIGGALGLEALGGQYLAEHGGATFAYTMMVAAEEGMEMCGVILFLHALLLYMEKQRITFRVVVNSGRPSAWPNEPPVDSRIEQPETTQEELTPSVRQA
jgi:hypothetical protein